MTKLSILFIALMIISMGLLSGCTDDSNNNGNGNGNGNGDLKGKFIGSWNWSGNNQTGEWTFYENNSLKSTFKGQYGAGVTDWWEYRIYETEICFTNPSDDKLTPACYDYESSSNHTLLTVIQNGQTAIWHKVL